MKKKENTNDFWHLGFRNCGQISPKKKMPAPEANQIAGIPRIPTNHDI